MKKSRKREKILLIIIFMLTGMLARIWQFGSVPGGGINQDEAFAAYEAYSLFHYGMDSHGYHFPVYLVAWGSGMNALNSYLMIPFIAIFGLKTWVIRLPQLICSSLTLYVVFLLIRKICNEKTAYCALFLLAVSPWHIFLSRWGLESNLAPSFLIFGLYFFVKGLEHSKFFLLSALMYGLSLYCYATIWSVVPIILLLQFLYCLWHKKMSFSRNVILALIVLALLALPLLLFLLVNFGMIDEITLPFISIPQMLHMRSNEVSFQHIGSNYVNLRNIILRQSDGLIWNATEKYGLFYYCTLPFVFWGGTAILSRTAGAFKHKEYHAEVFILIQFLAGLLLGLLIHVNINRVNIIWIPLIIFAAVGICEVCERIDKRLFVFFFCIYTVLFVRFEKYYFTDYAKEIAPVFSDGLESAMQEAVSYENDICVDGASWIKVLYYSKMPVEDYIASVQFKNYPSAFLQASAFGRFTFGYDNSEIDMNTIYIVKSENDFSAFEAAGFTLHTHAYFVVALPPGTQ